MGCLVAVHFCLGWLIVGAIIITVVTWWNKIKHWVCFTSLWISIRMVFPFYSLRDFPYCEVLYHYCYIVFIQRLRYCTHNKELLTCLGLLIPIWLPAQNRHGEGYLQARLACQKSRDDAAKIHEDANDWRIWCWNHGYDEKTKVGFQC